MSWRCCLKSQVRHFTRSSFGELEHDMWQRGAVAYSNTFAPVTRQATNTLLDMAGVQLTRSAAISLVEKSDLELTGSELHVLDVACGPGQIAQAAAERGASKVVALDFSKRMLEAAQPIANRFPDRVELVEGDAAALPFEDACFDAVVIGFGLLHLPHPHAAIKEAFRVLKPGRRLSFSVWEKPFENSVFQIMLDAVREHGNPNVQLPDVDGHPPLPFFHFADFENSRAALAAAGFDETTVMRTVVPVHVALGDVDGLFQMFATATARTRATLDLQSAEQLGNIRAAIASRVERFRGPMTHNGVNCSTSWHPPDAEIPGIDLLTLSSKSSGFVGGRAYFTLPMFAVVISATKQ